MPYDPELAKSFRKWQKRKTKIGPKDWEHYKKWGSQPWTEL